MTHPLAAAEAISRIPGVEPAKARYRALGGGLSNRSWLVETEDRRLVMRLDGRRAKAIGMDRRTEAAVLRSAAGQGVAPEIAFADADAGILVYEYLPGRCWTPADLESGANLEALAELLRKVHALPRSGVPFDAAGAAARYLELIRGNPDLSSFGRRCQSIVESIPPPAEAACCHNDVVAANVIATPALRLVDWEYACDNDPLFDLASVIGYHDLGDARAETLLAAWSGGSSPELGACLRRQVRLFDALQWLWLAAMCGGEPAAPQGRRLEQLARRIASGAPE